MIARSLERYLKISSKKLRLVVDSVRGKCVADALGILPNVKKKGSEYVMDGLKSAVANVKVKFPEANYTEDMLVISRITADEGPMLRRFRAATMGRASTIRKRSSHLTVELDLIPEKVAEKEAKKKTKSKSTKEKSVKKQAVAKGSK